MRLKSIRIRAVLVGAGFCLGAASAQAGYLLQEDFDDGMATYAATGASNIRSATGHLNTAVNTGFNSFFGSAGAYLALGDSAGVLDSGTIAGPVGTAAGQASMASFGLGLFAAGSNHLTIVFDYALDTNLAPGTGLLRSPDDFFARLMADSTQIDELVWFDDVARNEASRKGNFNQTVHFNLATAQEISLVFGVVEYLNNGDSAAGIDNISVIPEPNSFARQSLGVEISEPNSMALLGLGLVGLGALRRQRSKAETPPFF